jgi:hypothetical protein
MCSAEHFFMPEPKVITLNFRPFQQAMTELEYVKSPSPYSILS